VGTLTTTSLRANSSPEPLEKVIVKRQPIRDVSCASEVVDVVDQSLGGTFSRKASRRG